MGGANEIGSVGFLEGFAEMMMQMKKEGCIPDYIFHATGTGGTLAGLLAGKKVLNSNVKIISVDVSNKTPEFYDNVASLCEKTLERAGFHIKVTSQDINHDLNYFGKGYEIPTTAASDAIKKLARTEGILVDPVYSGKALSGLLDYVKSGKIKKGSTVVFWHTGGATALFAEKDILGNIFD